MRSTVYPGAVVHTRRTPRIHGFRYPFYTYGFDLDELPILADQLAVFSLDARNVLSLHAADYLHAYCSPERPLKDRVLAAIADRTADPALPARVARVRLITAPRFFGYAFNPVNFFMCFADDGTLAAVLVEVYNTFEESHLYFLDRAAALEAPKATYVASYACPKAFHVSPFNSTGDGESYEFHFADPADRLDIRINLVKAGETVLSTRMMADTAVPLDSSATVLGVLARFPLEALLTTPRIMWEAAKLHYRKHLPVYAKPNPSSPDTTRNNPPSADQIADAEWVLGFLTKISASGNVRATARLPDGSTWSNWPEATASCAVELAVKTHDVFLRVLLDGDRGFDNAFAWRDVECSSLPVFFFMLACGTLPALCPAEEALLAEPAPGADLGPSEPTSGPDVLAAIRASCAALGDGGDWDLAAGSDRAARTLADAAGASAGSAVLLLGQQSADAVAAELAQRGSKVGRPGPDGRAPWDAVISTEWARFAADQSAWQLAPGGRAVFLVLHRCGGIKDGTAMIPGKGALAVGGRAGLAGRYAVARRSFMVWLEHTAMRAVATFVQTPYEMDEIAGILEQEVLGGAPLASSPAQLPTLAEITDGCSAGGLSVVDMQNWTPHLARTLAARRCLVTRHQHAVESALQEASVRTQKAHEGELLARLLECHLARQQALLASGAVGLVMLVCEAQKKPL